MCTMSWRARVDGYVVYFNRDERRTRKPAEPPAPRRKGATRFVAPIDGDFGGTWIAVNEHGLTLALQNGYMDAEDLRREPPEGFTSRGLLLTALIDSRSADQALRRLARLPLPGFRSFHLALFDRERAPRRIDFVGGRLAPARPLEADRPLVSSSYSAPEVRASRIEVYRQQVVEPGPADDAALEARHLDYHAAHRPDRGPFSPCMHRPDAHTVSFSRIRVDAATIAFDYRDRAPCHGPGGLPTVTLDQ